MELAHFYGWTIEYLRSLTMYELDRAREYMISYNRQQQGGGQQPNGGQRHSQTSRGGNR